MFDRAEREYVESARIARLATADDRGRPSAVPVCFAFDGDRIVTAVDEKPQDASPGSLRRCRDVRSNPFVTLVLDHYVEDWSRLGWVQVRGTASVLESCDDGHGSAVTALRSKYDQYADHELEARPVIAISPGSVRSWGRLDRARDG